MESDESALSPREKWQAEIDTKKEELELKRRELGIKEDEAVDAPSAREKWQAEQDYRRKEQALKRRELAIKKVESKRAARMNPLVVAIFTAALAGVVNLFVSAYSASKQRESDERKAADTEKLEIAKAEASLILEVVKTLSPERAAENLKFLVDTKLIANQARRNDITAYLDTRDAGKGIFIPPVSASGGVNATSLTCSVRDAHIQAVAKALDKALEKQDGIQSDRPWEFREGGSGAKKAIFVGPGMRAQITLFANGSNTRVALDADGLLLTLGYGDILAESIKNVTDATLRGLPGASSNCPEIATKVAAQREKQ